MAPIHRVLSCEIRQCCLPVASVLHTKINKIYKKEEDSLGRQVYTSLEHLDSLGYHTWFTDVQNLIGKGHLKNLNLGPPLVTLTPSDSS